MNAFFIACVIALLAFVPVPTLQTLLATAASTLFESTPFILAGTLLAGAAPRLGARAVPLLGCGCTGGRAARSLPAAVAAAFAFGPLIAAARFALSWLPLGKRLRSHERESPSFGADLSALTLPAAGAAALAMATRSGMFHSLPLEIALAAASVAAPCGFGALAFGITLRHFSPPLATIAVIAGGLFPVAHRFTPRGTGHDGLAYATGSLACAVAALHHGASLVNPRFTTALWACAVLLAVLTFRYRNERAAKTRWAPGAMLVASIVAQPAPQYAATEVTLQDAFPGEHVEFAGVLVSEHGNSELVREAITCCRADAQPVSVLLATRVAAPDGTWMHVSGLFRAAGGRYVVDGKALRITAPADPFLYR